MSTYVPGRALVGQPTPQTDPDLFSADEISAEIKHLVRLNKRLGSHPLRTATYLRLMAYLDCRRRCGTGEADGCDPNRCRCSCHQPSCGHEWTTFDCLECDR